MADFLLAMPAWQALTVSAVAPGICTLGGLWLVVEGGRFVRLALTGRL